MQNPCCSINQSLLPSLFGGRKWATKRPPSEHKTHSPCISAFSWRKKRSDNTWNSPWSTLCMEEAMTCKYLVPSAAISTHSARSSFAPPSSFLPWLPDVAQALLKQAALLLLLLLVVVLVLLFLSLLGTMMYEHDVQEGDWRLLLNTQSPVAAEENSCDFHSLLNKLELSSCCWIACSKCGDWRVPMHEEGRRKREWWWESQHMQDKGEADTTTPLLPISLFKPLSTQHTEDCSNLSLSLCLSVSLSLSRMHAKWWLTIAPWRWWRPNPVWWMCWVMHNLLYGVIISDLSTGLIGGLGLIDPPSRDHIGETRKQPALLIGRRSCARNSSSLHCYWQEQPWPMQTAPVVELRCHDSLSPSISCPLLHFPVSLFQWYQNCHWGFIWFSCSLGSSLFPELLFTYVCVLLFFGVLSISRIAVHICVCSLCFVAPLYFQNCSVHMYVINVISPLLLMNVRSLIAKSTYNSFDCNQAARCKLSLSLSLCASVQCWFMGQVYSGLVHGCWFLNFYEASFQLYIAGIRTCGERERELF